MQFVQKFTRKLTTRPWSAVTTSATLFSANASPSHSAIIPQAGMSGVLTYNQYEVTVEYIQNLQYLDLQYKAGDPEVVYVHPIRLEIGRTIALFVQGHHRLARIKKVQICPSSVSSSTSSSIQPASVEISVAAPRIMTQHFDDEDIMTAVMDQPNEAVNVHPRSTTRMIPREELDQGPDYARMNLVAFFRPPPESAGTSERVAVISVPGLAQDGNGSAIGASTPRRRKPVPVLDSSLRSSQNDNSASRDNSDGGIADFTHPTASPRSGVVLPQLDSHPSYYTTSNSSPGRPRRQSSAQNNFPAASSDVVHPGEGFPHSTSTSTRTSSSASADLARHVGRLPTIITDDNNGWRGDFDSFTFPRKMDLAASSTSGAAIIAPQGSSPRNLSPVSSLELPKPLSRQISRKLSMRKPLPALPEHSAAQLGLDGRRGSQDLQRLPRKSTQTSGVRVVKASSNPSIRRVALHPERESFKSDDRHTPEDHQQHLDKGKDRARPETPISTVSVPKPFDASTSLPLPASDTLMPPISSFTYRTGHTTSGTTAQGNRGGGGTGISVPQIDERVSGDDKLKAVNTAQNTVSSRAYVGGTMGPDGNKRAASSGPSRTASRTVGEPF